VAALVFNVTANLLLIPRFGFIGAAWVTVASEVVLLVPFRIAALRVAPGVSLLREAQAPLLATLLMAPVVWWLRDAIHPLAAVAAGAIVYPLALWSLGGIDAAQRRLIAEFVR
jgi:O-antigen/teichoic acid export membrane protein